MQQFNIVENAEINQHLSTIISRRTQPDRTSRRQLSRLSRRLLPARSCAPVLPSSSAPFTELQAQAQADPNQMQTDVYTAAPAPKPATTAASYQRTVRHQIEANRVTVHARAHPRCTC